MKKPSSRLNLAVKGLLTALAILLILECVARVAQTVLDDMERGSVEWYEYSSDLGWQRRPGYKGEAFNQPVDFDAQGYRNVDTLQVADTATPRVLTLGDSVTFGYGVPTEETFSEQLDARLPGASVINLGVTGYSAFQRERALEDYTRRLKPALVILAGQYNDRRYVLDDSEIDCQAHFRHLARSHRLRQWSRRIYIVRGLGLLMHKTGLLPYTVDPGRPTAAVETIDHPIDLEKIPTRVEPERYREQLTLEARWCREQGIPIIFMTLADNSMMTRPIEEAVKAETEGDIETAIAQLESVLRPQDVYTTMARLMLAKIYRSQGDNDKAEVYAGINRPLYTLHGGFPLYQADLYNRIMREVASEEGVALAEAAPWLNAHPEYFLDQCHFDPAGHAGVAAILAAKIAELDLTELGPVDTTPLEDPPALTLSDPIPTAP